MGSIVSVMGTAFPPSTRSACQAGPPPTVPLTDPELAVDQVSRPGSAGVSDGGAHSSAAADPDQVVLAHQPFDRAPGHRGALDEHLLAAQLVVDLPGAIQPAAGLSTLRDASMPGVKR
jgi:hypothetical protein